MKKTLLSSLMAAALLGAACAGAQTLNIAFADPLSSLDPQLNNHAGDCSVDLHFWDLLVENNYSKALIERILQGAATEANQWMPADTFGHNPKIRNIPNDANQARNLLAQAGYPQGFKLTIHVPNDRYPQAPEIMQAVAQFWARIGVKTQVEVLPWASYSSRAKKNEFAVSVLAWGNGTGEASYALVNVLAAVDARKGLGASNWNFYSNPAIDKALTDSTAEFDAARREAILRNAVNIVSDDVGVIPLYHYQNIWAAKKGLKVTPASSDRTTAMMVTQDKK